MSFGPHSTSIVTFFPPKPAFLSCTLFDELGGNISSVEARQTKFLVQVIFFFGFHASFELLRCLLYRAFMAWAPTRGSYANNLWCSLCTLTELEQSKLSHLKLRILTFEAQKQPPPGLFCTFVRLYFHQPFRTR